MGYFLLAAVAIVVVVCLLAAYAIHTFSSTSARIVTVFLALAMLLGVLPRLFDALRPDLIAPPAAPAAPQHPGATGGQATGERVHP
ncbi:hypothetical protein [Streptomyces lichenis]|uniref:Uncharacterized protein n=1 Tax=Streptomyces lichenis TaxID=2306967 RepID=A0ABT0IJD8_9ACTN|nr:hypothetical protein [Streptomyces lichenis]MCK8681390.1 hypothetical protein [Streptomyces lichenis]